MKKLAVVTTHPIQYYAPLFKLLQQQIDLVVFYTWGEQSVKKHDPGFGKIIEWDADLFDGYNYQWVVNTADNPGSHHFKGIVNPELVQQIDTFKPDALLIFGWAYQSHLKVMRHFKGRVPVWFRGDSTLLDEKSGLKSWLRSLLLKWVYTHVDHAFYVGANNKAYFRKYGLKEQQLSFAPHAIDNNQFAADRTTDVAALKQSLGIKQEDLVILFAGKFEEKKDPLLLLTAFLRLNKPDAHLLFTGSGVLQQQLKTAASGNANVHFIDFQNQQYMPVVYQACDLFCLPSRGPAETWGLAVNEAMACGKAILVSNKVGCAIDLVKPDKNGDIFESKNADDLVRALTKLTASKDKLSEYGRRSKTIIASWNFEQIASAIKTRINEKN
nr:glycosyltransferase family 4 protein [uncultured Mucilaginibacter sp.]